MYHQHNSAHGFYSYNSVSMPVALDSVVCSGVLPLSRSQEAALHSTITTTCEISNNIHTNLLSLDLASVIEDAFSCGIYPSSSPGVQLSSTTECFTSGMDSEFCLLGCSHSTAISVPMSLLPCTSEFRPNSTWSLPVTTITESGNSVLEGRGNSRSRASPVIDLTSATEDILNNGFQLRKDRRFTSNLNRKAKRKAKTGELYSCGSMKRLATPQPYDSMVRKFRLKK